MNCQKYKENFENSVNSEKKTGHTINEKEETKYNIKNFQQLVY